MQIHKNLSELPKFKNAVITVGTFDGIHFGHKKILARINELAKQVNGESILITFHPHPRIVVKSEPDVRLLTTLPEKIEILAKEKIDHLVIVPFNRSFSNQSAENYIENFLVKNFEPKIIAIGYNHQFGKNRAGNFDLLKSYSKKCNFDLEVITKQQIEDLKLSSSNIRKYINNGNVSKANLSLGYNFFLKGNVIKGDQIGRTIGFPTANININLKEKLIPKIGIYACKVFRNEEQYKGMLYIGTRPVLNDTKLCIEVNIFDFNENIYGEVLKIELIKYIRADENLASLEILKAKMEEDKLNCIAALQKI